MKITIARHAGFCFGVKRALEMVETGLTGLHKKSYSLGPLIHNPQTVARLESKGLRPIEDIDQIDSGNLVIRSHGVTPETLDRARNKGLWVIDATCPFVQKAQQLAKNLDNDGYQVVVVGDESHPEVVALVGWAGGKAIVIETRQEASDLPFFPKIGVVAQTTQTEANFLEVVEVLKNKTEDLVVHNTICHATRDRQKAAVELACHVDIMFVVGGRNSSNTRKLAKVCKDTGTPTFHIEGVDELDPRWFKNINRVGVTAGASTPDWIIEEVVQRMTEFNEDLTPEENMEEKIEEGSAPEAAEDEFEIQEVNVAAEDASQESIPEAQTETVTEPEPRDDSSQEVEAHLAENLKNIRRGDIISGTVVQINENEVLVDVGGKSEGIIPMNELSLVDANGVKESLQVGDTIEVQVIRVENEEGNPVLSKKRADRRKAWEDLEQSFENGTELQGKVIEVVKGGLLVDVGVRGFVPASLVERGYVADLSQYVEKELRLRVIELDRNKNKIVLSQKAILDEEYDNKKQETWETLEEGQTRKGVVRRITDFGAFVDLGGVDGLLHVSEIAWGRVDHPGDILTEGQELEVFVLGVDRAGGKVSLGLKQLRQNPWTVAAQKYNPGTIVEGKVLRIAPFGAFVEVEPGVEGLVHISQLAEEHVEKTEDVVSVGDVIPVKILSVDPEAQRMSLSLRQTKEKEKAPEREPEKVFEEKPKKKKEAPPENNNYSDDDSGIKIGDLVGDLFSNLEDQE